MTKIKMCGLTREEDIDAVNEIMPDYIGFVFWKKSKRYISPEMADFLKGKLKNSIKSVGVFINEDIIAVADFLKRGIIDIAQLHGDEDEQYILSLKKMTGKPVIKAFRIKTKEDALKAEKSPADMILLDAGAGDGRTFDWSLIGSAVKRPYFLAGGLDPSNAGAAIEALDPWGLDVSSGIESEGKKDKKKMTAFVKAVRKD